MNALATSSSAPAGAVAPLPEDDDNIRLSEYLDILIDYRWLVAGITAVAVAIGVAYALLSTPVYQSNLLIQVEDSAPDAKNFLGDTANLFDVKTPASGEIQIIRSRMIIGGAVEATRLYINARPRYVPVVGEWLARRARGLSDPGFLGMSGYVSGTETINIPKFDVPPAFEDQAPFTITVQPGDQFILTHPDLGEPVTGSVGKLLTRQLPEGALALIVSQINGKPGAQFLVSRASLLATTEDLQKRIQLSEQGKQSNVISATLEDSDRERLRRILDEIGMQYVRQNIDRKAAEAEKTLQFLDSQLPDFKKQLESSKTPTLSFAIRMEQSRLMKKQRQFLVRRYSCKLSCLNQSNFVATFFRVLPIRTLRFVLLMAKSPRFVMNSMVSTVG